VFLEEEYGLYFRFSNTSQALIVKRKIYETWNFPSGLEESKGNAEMPDRH